MSYTCAVLHIWRNMEIKMIRLADIKPYENNPRDNERAVQPVTESIRQFGFRVPMVLDADNVIIAGHTRYLAANELKLEEVPAIYADDLTPEQIKAFRLVDNKIQEIAEWDWDAIFEELDLIQGIDMKLLGFEEFLNNDQGEMKERKIAESFEIDTDSFADEEFAQECPHCGFRFNE